MTARSVCVWCSREIVRESDGLYGWVDPEATGDDSVWREVCDSHESFTAEHKPAYAEPGAMAPTDMIGG